MASKAEIANLYQFAYLITKKVLNSVGSGPLTSAIIKSGVDKYFSVNEKGWINIKFDKNDANAEAYYRQFFHVIADVISVAFGRDYTKNIFNEKYKRLEEMSLNPSELEIIKKIGINPNI